MTRSARRCRYKVRYIYADGVYPNKSVELTDLDFVKFRIKHEIDFPSIVVLCIRDKDNGWKELFRAKNKEEFMEKIDEL